MPGETSPYAALDYLIGRAPVLYFTLSRDGGIVQANAYAREFTGRQLIGESIGDVIVDFTGAFDPEALAEDPSREHLYNVDGASGLPQSFYFTFSHTEDRIHAFGRLDVGELEAMRKQILVLNQELTNLTRALHKSNAELKRLNEEKNRFLGMAAHDLRKPIGIVLAYSEFLIDEAADLLSGEQIGFLDTIRSSSAFMKRLVDDFLDVSAIEAGKLDLELRTASLRDALDYALTLNGIQAGKKGIELRVRCEDGLPSVSMDASKIEQVITNLVSNAIEHTSPNSPVIITLTSDRQSVVFSVEDRGRGIPPEERDRLFEPFATSAARKTGGERGTGLGLLISRKIIEAHDGRIWLDSEPGNGARIHFSLPLRRDRE